MKMKWPYKDRRMVMHIKSKVMGGVYIGRDKKDPKGRGKWGNPFVIEKGVRTRAESIAQYQQWIHHPDQAALKARIVPELRHKILLCWCKPLDCHGDVLAEIANGVEG